MRSSLRVLLQQTMSTTESSLAPDYLRLTPLPLPKSIAPARAFIKFVNASPTPFHAVAESVLRLEAVGFTRLSEKDAWDQGDKIRPGGKYYVTRNQSSLIAFTVPEYKKEDEGKPRGISIVGCHTDSPRFIVKPVSRREIGGFAQVGVETYGGGIWATWLDRDLGIAGRVTLSGTTSSMTQGVEYSSHLVLHREPILRMPTIAIHLERSQNDKFYYNPETQQVPILAMANKALNESFAREYDTAEVSFKDPLAITSHHHRQSSVPTEVLAGALRLNLSFPHFHPKAIMLHAIASSLSKSLGEEITPAQIHDFELSLFDVQPSTIGGALNEFIFSPRLDNLFSSFAAVQGLVQSVSSPTWATTSSDGRISMIALFDHEEVGSVSAFGAESNFIESTIERVSVALKSPSESTTSAYQRSLAHSFLLSTDMGHSLHPSFPERHEDLHKPLMNAGPAIKTNAKQRYASTAQTTFLLRRVAAMAQVPLQEYEVRNDMACGSTIGPLVSKIGLRTVDIGCPQLSMHSIRETAGTKDMALLIQLFEAYFANFGKVDDLQVD
ncbi:BQ2448_1019 [Microbotryum intermedium]|uniref:aspartyl aminopeptidase n=1 Tax=Microbotryum intermedium TaxID=269621 RepID=A0A238FCM7_9BASI|nr:BQ2448_1019 [Microbotryum intermedium]